MTNEIYNQELPSETLSLSDSNPSERGFASGSDINEDEWTSCAGEAEKGMAGGDIAVAPETYKTVLALDGVQRSPEFDRCQNLETEEENSQLSSIPHEPISLDSQDQSSPFPLGEESVAESVCLGHSEKDKTAVSKLQRDSGAARRKISYQKAMQTSVPLTSSLNGVTSFSSCSPPMIEEPESSPGLLEVPSHSLHISKSTSSGSISSGHERHSLPMPIYDDSSLYVGTNISRSVSFNDCILKPRPASVELCDPPHYDVRGRRGSNSTPSSPIRRLLSSPGRFQSIKLSSGSPSPDDSPTGDARGRKSFKAFTSQFTRHLSFRSRKGVRPMMNDKLSDIPTANASPNFDDGVVSCESLRRLFECPGCSVVMPPPLVQCKKGHLVCEKCRTSLKGMCPVCKQRVTKEDTNFMMEQVYQLVRFPCQFTTQGCPEYHSPKQKTNHENFCIYRPVSCHFESQGCSSILPLKDMNSHINGCEHRFKRKLTVDKKQ